MKKFIYGLIIVIIVAVVGAGVFFFLKKSAAKPLTETQKTVKVLKSYYNILSAAYNKAVEENGTLDTWGVGDNAALARKLKPYMSVDWGEDDNICWGIVGHEGMACALLDDTTCQQNRGKGKLTNSCGHIKVNVKTPEWPSDKDGIDMFDFVITKDGLVPNGTSDQEDAYPCVNYGISDACTDWVIKKGNMGYLN